VEKLLSQWLAGAAAHEQDKEAREQEWHGLHQEETMCVSRTRCCGGAWARGNSYPVVQTRGAGTTAAVAGHRCTQGRASPGIELPGSPSFSSSTTVQCSSFARFSVFRYFEKNVASAYVDVAKVGQDVAMLHMFYTNVVSVLSIYCIFNERFECSIQYERVVVASFFLIING
jgi:hypothetical protein